MELKLKQLPIQNKVMQAYENDTQFIHTYFDYENKTSSFKKRYDELEERVFDRKEISEVIHSFMKPFGVSPRAKNHIEELSNNAVTVVGGQQAGILTGPLYSVHKAISVVLLAKQQREKLGVPVVPVFWVAGEDHDLNEINHVYTEVNGQLTKEQIRDQFVYKLMASDAQFDQEDMKRFVKNIFKTYGETIYTAELLAEVLSSIEQENTFTGFFVRLMNGLFADEGLLFLDAAYKPLRKLESEFFQSLIKNAKPIAEVIAKKEQQFEGDGFGQPIAADAEAANLFYVHETGRVLLSRRDGLFVNEGINLQFTEEELLKVAKEEPWLLSNNVTTRPLMQDYVLPVLAFIGGPGEIAYWALLKEAFHLLNMKMPVIVPRMSMTIVSRRVQKMLEDYSLDVLGVFAGKIADERQRFLSAIQDNAFENEVNRIKEMLATEFEKLKDCIGSEEKAIQRLLDQNYKHHSKQFTYLKNKAEELVLQKHEATLYAFDLLEAELFPNGGLQERSHTPYTYLNEHGPTLIQDMLKLPLDFDGTHKFIYL